MRKLVRSFMPPIVLELLGRTGLTRNTWSGDYATWEEARRASTGYDAQAILDRVLHAALKVQRGQAAYERDSVVFDQVEYSWPVLAGLCWAAARDRGRLEVLDFGGALGSSYAQNRAFLNLLPDHGWNVVEQPHFVAAGRAQLTTDRLRFYETIENCIEARRPNVALLSSVLQYVEHPDELLDRLANAVPTLLIDLTPVWPGVRDRITVQTVPPTIYRARYPCWVFGETRLESVLRSRFAVVATFDPEIGREMVVGGDQACYRGWILRRRG